MWQTLLVVLIVLLAGWYVFRRLRRTVKPGPGGSCACGGHEGPCPLNELEKAPPPSPCQGCPSCPQPGDSGPQSPLPKK